MQGTRRNVHAAAATCLNLAETFKHLLGVKKLLMNTYCVVGAQLESELHS